MQRVRGTGEPVQTQTLEVALLPGLGGAEREEPLCQGPYCPLGPPVGLARPLPCPEEQPELWGAEKAPPALSRGSLGEGGTQHPSHRGAFLLCLISSPVKWRLPTPAEALVSFQVLKAKDNNKATLVK